MVVLCLSQNPHRSSTIWLGDLFGIDIKTILSCDFKFQCHETRCRHYWSQCISYILCRTKDAIHYTWLVIRRSRTSSAMEAFNRLQNAVWCLEDEHALTSVFSMRITKRQKILYDGRRVAWRMTVNCRRRLWSLFANVCDFWRDKFRDRPCFNVTMFESWWSLPRHHRGTEPAIASSLARRHEIGIMALPRFEFCMCTWKNVSVFLWVDWRTHVGGIQRFEVNREESEAL